MLIKDWRTRYKKQIGPWPNGFPLAEPYFFKKKLVPRWNGVFNIQGEAKKIKKRAWVLNFNLNVYNMTDFNMFNKI